MNKSTITKAQLQEWVAQLDNGDGCNATDRQLEVLIRQSLAAMDAEPVADVVGWHKEGEERTCDIRWRRFDVAPGPLFAVPQPFMKDHQIRELVNELRDIAVQYHGTQQLRERIARTVRAAILNHSEVERYMVEPVSQPYTLRECVAALRNSGIEIDAAKVLAERDTGNSPVIPDGLIPMQPLVIDHLGTLRFKENPIVRSLLDYASERGYDLNEIACAQFDAGEQMQLAQLIGYSLSGYGTLSYVTDESYNRAAAAAPQQEGK